MHISTTQEYVRSDALLVSLSEHVPCQLRVNNVGPFSPCQSNWHGLRLSTERVNVLPKPLSDHSAKPGQDAVANRSVSTPECLKMQRQEQHVSKIRYVD